jgi:predicted ester cyclase
MSTEQNKERVKQAVQVFNNPETRESYFDFYDSSCVLHGYPPEMPPNVEGMRQFYRGVWAAFPDCEVVAEDLIAEGDKVAGRYVLQGTHTGEFMGIAPTGNRIAVRAAAVFRLVNGKCVERWQYFDEAGLLRQLGAMPTPGGGQ